MHCLKDFESHAIPLIGVIGASRATFNIDPQAAVSATFTEQSLDGNQRPVVRMSTLGVVRNALLTCCPVRTRCADGFTALRALQTQLRVLAQSEEHTRQVGARTRTCRHNLQKDWLAVALLLECCELGCALLTTAGS